MENNTDYFSYNFDDIINEPVYNDLTNDFHYLPAQFYTDETDYYSQLGGWYRFLSEKAKNNLIKNLTGYIKNINGPKSEYIVNRQLCHWFRTDMNLGIAIARGLDLDLSETIKQMPQLM